jgi:hypothetical protein
MRRALLFFVFVVGLAFGLAPRALAKAESFAFDEVSKEFTASKGETNAVFRFGVTNVSKGPVMVNWARASCGCTVAKLPSTPWNLEAGESGSFEVVVDLRGKYGTFTKFITLDTSEGQKILNVKLNIPGGPAAAASGGSMLDSRTRNLQIALKDRQAVFKGDCAKCHVEPAVGRTGQALFEAACAICHESPHRATMVTDLRALKVAPTPEYWQAMISHGKPNTLMPAFLQSEGGPLTEEQVKSLVDYMTHYYPPRASVSAPSPYHDD